MCLILPCADRYVIHYPDVLSIWKTVILDFVSYVPHDCIIPFSWQIPYSLCTPEKSSVLITMTFNSSQHIWFMYQEIVKTYEGTIHSEIYGGLKQSSQNHPWITTVYQNMKSHTVTHFLPRLFYNPNWKRLNSRAADYILPMIGSYTSLWRDTSSHWVDGVSWFGVTAAEFLDFLDFVLLISISKYQNSQASHTHKWAKNGIPMRENGHNNERQRGLQRSHRSSPCSKLRSLTLTLDIFNLYTHFLSVLVIHSRSLWTLRELRTSEFPIRVYQSPVHRNRCCSPKLKTISQIHCYDLPSTLGRWLAVKAAKYNHISSTKNRASQCSHYVFL